MFVADVVLGFAFVDGLAFSSVTKHFAQKQPRWDALRWSIHFVSVGLTIRALALAAHLVHTPLAWLLVPVRPPLRKDFTPTVTNAPSFRAKVVGAWRRARDP